MTNQSAIKVVSLGGYALHGLDVQVATALQVPASDVQKFDWSSEGNGTSYFMSQPVPADTDPVDVLSAIWDIQNGMMDGTVEDRSTGEYVNVFSTPYQFEIDGRQYEWVAEMLGYDAYSTDPTDPRYGE